MLRKPVEAMSAGTGRLVRCSDAHPFAEAVYHAFFDHHPLMISPDAVWFCLAQGFAQHIARNAERLRHRFVRHEGKAQLIVERRDFVLGQDNPWPEVFTTFSDQIAEHVGKLRDLVVADFSTTGPIERAASEVALMDAFQPYFEYEVLFGCGIPSITLTGTPDDWRSVRCRAAMLAEFELEWWTSALLPVLDEIVRTAEGRVDRSFWQSFFRYESTSFGDELTGWIHTLFPHLRRLDDGSLGPNPYLARWEAALRVAETRSEDELRGVVDQEDCWTPAGLPGPSLREIPAGIASAPVRLMDVRDGSEHSLRFVAGMFGVTQDPGTLLLVPEFGWAVVHDR